MNKIWKTGILLITLAIPVFIWLFLKFFGHNNFEIPVYYPNGIDSIPGCTSSQEPHVIPAFSLSSIPGRTFTESEFDGEIVISFFLPYNCEDSCELVLEKLAGIQQVLSKTDNLKIVVFGDEKYTMEELKSLADRYHADPEQWYFLSGKQQAITTLKKCGFILSSFPLYTLVLTDEQSQIRGYYQVDDPEEVERLKGEVKILTYMQDQAVHD